MANRTAYVFVFDGFADWEPASALAELRRTFGFSVKTFALAIHPIVSMGGLKVAPDLLLEEIRPELADILILPGGDAWMAGEVEGITGLIKAVHKATRPVAAICAATLSLAHAGLLDDHRHTSNGDGFIARYVPAYRGRDLYAKVPAVTDRNVITANGVAPFAFAAEIFRIVAPDREHDIATYEALYSRGLLDD
jgi:putative intracellular protease/amidase